MLDQLFEELISKDGTAKRNQENDYGQPEVLAGEILSSGDDLFIDRHLDWQVERQMNLTAGKQAALLVQTFRQRELDQVRYQQAASLGHHVALDAATYIERNDRVVAYYELHHPRTSHKVQRMVDELDACLGQLPRASILSYLSRYYGR